MMKIIFNDRELLLNPNSIEYAEIETEEGKKTLKVHLTSGRVIVIKNPGDDLLKHLEAI